MLDEKAKELNTIYEHYGVSHQIEMLVEEMAELTQAIQKEKRYHSVEAIYHKLGEMADVAICLAQLVNNLSEKEKQFFFDTIDMKLERTIKIIKGELI